jgi:peptidoglycan/xylan/chitin deacetylase (PgdA/CDA1 family)
MSLKHRLHDNALSIFLFHGVVKGNEHPVRNYTSKHIAEDDFVRHMKELSAAGVALSMDEVLDRCREGVSFPPKAFAITFDDGFENNISVAAPVLADFSIPATFYLTSGFVDGNAMSWIDRIEYCLEEAGDVTVQLPWNDGLSRITSAGDAIRVLDEIRREVKASPEMDVEGLVAMLFDQCGVEPIRSSDDSLDLKMTWKQVRELDADPAFTVGGHTHTHAIMSYLSPSALDREIDISLDLLRDRAGIVSRHYSYPEGQADHYSEEVILALKNRGIECCPTAIDGVNEQGSDPFHLKRIMVG